MKTVSVSRSSHFQNPNNLSVKQKDKQTEVASAAEVDAKDSFWKTIKKISIVSFGLFAVISAGFLAYQKPNIAPVSTSSYDVISVNGKMHENSLYPPYGFTAAIYNSTGYCDANVFESPKDWLNESWDLPRMQHELYDPDWNEMPSEGFQQPKIQELDKMDTTSEAPQSLAQEQPEESIDEATQSIEEEHDIETTFEEDPMPFLPEWHKVAAAIAAFSGIAAIGLWLKKCCSKKGRSISSLASSTPIQVQSALTRDSYTSAHLGLGATTSQTSKFQNMPSLSESSNSAFKPRSPNSTFKPFASPKGADDAILKQAAKDLSAQITTTVKEAKSSKDMALLQSQVDELTRKLEQLEGMLPSAIKRTMSGREESKAAVVAPRVLVSEFEAVSSPNKQKDESGGSIPTAPPRSPEASFIPIAPPMGVETSDSSAPPDAPPMEFSVPPPPSEALEEKSAAKSLELFSTDHFTKTLGFSANEQNLQTKHLRSEWQRHFRSIVERSDPDRFFEFTIALNKKQSLEILRDSLKRTLAALDNAEQTETIVEIKRSLQSKIEETELQAKGEKTPKELTFVRDEAIKYHNIELALILWIWQLKGQSILSAEVSKMIDAELSQLPVLLKDIDKEKGLTNQLWSNFSKVKFSGALDVKEKRIWSLFIMYFYLKNVEGWQQFFEAQGARQDVVIKILKDRKGKDLELVFRPFMERRGSLPMQSGSIGQNEEGKKSFISAADIEAFKNRPKSGRPRSIEIPKKEEPKKPAFPQLRSISSNKGEERKVNTFDEKQPQAGPVLQSRMRRSGSLPDKLNAQQPPPGTFVRPALRPVKRPPTDQSTALVVG